jgi:hypothetical protein
MVSGRPLYSPLRRLTPRMGLPLGSRKAPSTTQASQQWTAYQELTSIGVFHITVCIVSRVECHALWGDSAFRDTAADLREAGCRSNDALVRPNASLGELHASQRPPAYRRQRRTRCALPRSSVRPSSLLPRPNMAPEKQV